MITTPGIWKQPDFLSKSYPVQCMQEYFNSSSIFTSLPVRRQTRKKDVTRLFRLRHTTLMKISESTTGTDGIFLHSRGLYGTLWVWGVLGLGGGWEDFISGSGGKVVWVATRAKIRRIFSDTDCADILCGSWTTGGRVKQDLVSWTSAEITAHARS